MAHFAQLDNLNNVINVVVVNNETLLNLEFPYSEPVGIEFLKSIFGEDTRWKQTSYSSSFRGSFASVGFVYRERLDSFVVPRPFPSWEFNDDTLQWEAPVARPTDNPYVKWDEQSLQWIEE